MRRSPRALAALVSLVALAACGRAEGLSTPDVAGRRIRTVATTGMVADVVANVGGDRVEVSSLMGPGVDPHLYKASERDVIDIAGADLVFYNGLHLEAKMADVFEQASERIRTVAVAGAIDEDDLLAPPDFSAAYDPHVWFDVALWSRVVDPVRDALIDLDPDNADAYRRNAADYRRELAQLDGYVREQVQKIPAERRVLITAHDAFTYFGRAYGFEVRALQGISTASEAGAGDVRALAEYIADRRIPALFVETSVPTRFIEAVQEAVRSRGFDVRIGEALHSDALGPRGSGADSYVGMVRHNIDAIVGGLS